MKRYELIDGNSKKFWEIELLDEEVKTRYGRIGSAGTDSIKEFDDKWAAKAEYEKLIKAKMKKGYQLVSEDESNAKPTLRNEELENGLNKDVNNDQLFRDYGIWQQRNGILRGEFSALWSDKKPDKKKFKAFIKKHAKELLPESYANATHRIADPTDTKPIHNDNKDYSGDQTCFEFEWHYGFIRSAKLGLNYELWDEAPWGEHPDINITSEFSELESARFLRYLSFGVFNFDGESDYHRLLKYLAKKKPFPHLEGLFLGSFDSEELEISWSDLGDAGVLSGAYPKLKHLTLRSGNIQCSKLEFPELKTFCLISGGLPKKALKGLKKHQCPKLEHLEIYIGTPDYEGDINIKDLDFIFKGETFEKVKYLGLKNAEIQGEIAKKIVTAPILKQLETLDMSMGTLNDEEAEILLKNADKFAHLKLLDLSQNCLNKTADRFKKFPCKVNLEEQDQDDDDRYVSLGE